jgi:hypothetical protein
MTNVDFFRLFSLNLASHSSGKTYFFAHDRKSLDFSNLEEGTSPLDDQIKLFHFTTGIRTITYPSGGVEGVVYKGVLIAALKSDFTNVIDAQQGVDEDTARYNVHVKPLIDGGGIVAEIVDFNSCNTDHEIIFGEATEVYGLFDANMDGIWIPYTMTIKNQ